MNDNFELEAEQVKAYFKTLKDQELIKHYKFREALHCNLSSSSEVRNFIKDNKPITMSVHDGQIYYKLSTGMEKDELFTIDTEKSFSESNTWLFTKILNIELVFPNISEAPISNEMAAFFICLVIASVLQDQFEDEFLELVDAYDFKHWKPSSPVSMNFMELAKEWIQMGSELVKMIAASAKFSIAKNSQKKELPSQLDLDSDLDSRYKNLLREIRNTRFNYDDVKLSPENRMKMNKLEIKTLIAKRDEEVKRLITKDDDLHKIWRLLNLNSNVINPSIKRGFIRQSRKYSITLFSELNGGPPDMANEDHLFKLKRLQNKLKKEAIRAAINKTFQEELNKYKSDPDRYVAPNFV